MATPETTFQKNEKGAEAAAENQESKIPDVVVREVFKCRTKNCYGSCVPKTDMKVFRCPECNKYNCLECQVVHAGIECDNYKQLIASAIGYGLSREEAEECVHSELVRTWTEFLETVTKGIEATPAGKHCRGNQFYLKMLHGLAHDILWDSIREFKCPVCMNTIPVGNGIILQDCLHTVCKDCAIGTIQFATDLSVKCSYLDANYSCTSSMNPKEIKVLAPPEIYKEYLLRSVKQAEGSIPNSYHCKIPDCPGFCVFEEGPRVFKCQVCNKINCLPCGASHENMTCEDHKKKLVQKAKDEASKKDLEELIERVVDEWCAQLEKLGVGQTLGSQN